MRLAIMRPDPIYIVPNRDWKQQFICQNAAGSNSVMRTEVPWFDRVAAHHAAGGNTTYSGRVRLPEYIELESGGEGQWRTGETMKRSGTGRGCSH